MENTKNLFQRLAEVRKECNFIKKEQVGKNLSYKAVSSDMVLSAINNSVNTHGLFLITDIVSEKITAETKDNGYGKQVTSYTCELKLNYTWVNVDKPDDRLCVNWSCTALNTDPAKANGSTLTYAEKYFFLKFFNMVSSENANLDPDCQDIPENKPSKPESKPVEQPKPESKSYTKNTPAPAPKVTNIKQFDIDKCNDTLLTYKYIDQVRKLKNEVKKYYGEDVLKNSEVIALFKTYENLPEAPVSEVLGS